MEFSIKKHIHYPTLSLIKCPMLAHRIMPYIDHTNIPYNVDNIGYNRIENIGKYIKPGKSTLC